MTRLKEALDQSNHDIGNSHAKNKVIAEKVKNTEGKMRNLEMELQAKDDLVRHPTIEKMLDMLRNTFLRIRFHGAEKEAKESWRAWDFWAAPGWKQSCTCHLPGPIRPCFPHTVLPARDPLWLRCLWAPKLHFFEPPSPAVLPTPWGYHVTGHIPVTTRSSAEYACCFFYPSSLLVPPFQLKRKTAELAQACEKHYELEQELAFYKIDHKFEQLGKVPSPDTEVWFIFISVFVFGVKNWTFFSWKRNNGKVVFIFRVLKMAWLVRVLTLEKAGSAKRCCYDNEAEGMQSQRRSNGNTTNWTKS